jgi:hypothetical protein
MLIDNPTIDPAVQTSKIFKELSVYYFFYNKFLHLKS